MALLGCLLLCGCATHQAPVASQEPSFVAQTDAPALALACDPPVTADLPPLYLDRESRQPAAFAGYDQPTVTYSYLRITDRYRPFGDGRYERDAITDRVGVSTR